MYICQTFPSCRIEKLKAGILDGPQIRNLVKDPNFTTSMTETKSEVVDVPTST